MVASIIFLYIATTINFSLNWEFRHNEIVEILTISSDIGEIDNIYLIFEDPLVWTFGTVINITAIMSTVIADSIMVCAILVADLDISLVLYKL